jgi:hypothetical protein
MPPERRMREQGLAGSGDATPASPPVNLAREPVGLTVAYARASPTGSEERTGLLLPLAAESRLGVAPSECFGDVGRQTRKPATLPRHDLVVARPSARWSRCLNRAGIDRGTSLGRLRHAGVRRPDVVTSFRYESSRSSVGWRIKTRSRRSGGTVKPLCAQMRLASGRCSKMSSSARSSPWAIRYNPRAAARSTIRRMTACAASSP